MQHCPSCDRRLWGEDEHERARCRYCREPLYERAVDLRTSTKADEARCAVHADNVAVGTCSRCGNFLCALCRTRWRGTRLCIACVERALESREALPGAARRQWIHSLLATVLAAIAWLVTLFGFGLIAVGAQGGRDADLGLLIVGSLLFMMSGVPAVLGIGFGASAIRARGNHLILATIGVLLGGLHVGVLIGLFAFAFWQT